MTVVKEHKTTCHLTIYCTY